MSSKKYFGQVASEWDRFRESFFSEAVREKAFSVAGLAPGKIAADIGAGSGYLTEGLHRLGLRVIAVDQSETMLTEIKRKFQDSEAINCRRGQAENLPLPDETVDYAFANMCLHHIEDPPKAILEMVRILKLGGKLVITDLEEHRFESLRERHHDRWMGFKAEDICDWFQQGGLKNIRVDPAGERCCVSLGCGDDWTGIGIFVASGEK